MGFDVKYVLAPLFVGASLFGFRATILAMLDNGLGEALGAVASGATPALPGAPSPFVSRWTGITAIDHQLSAMVVFFSAAIDGDNVPRDATAFYVWGMAQFAASWTLLVLEAKRAGNRGRLVSWIGTVGLIFQNLTWTFTVPLYLALHLLTSPVARLRQGDGDGARRALFVYLWDLALLPMAVTLTFIVPAIFMSLPRLLAQEPSTHYSWVAFWQPFPVWTVAGLGLLHYTCYYALGSLTPVDDDGDRTTDGHGYMVGVRGVYEFILAISGVTHIPIMFLTLMPAAGREFLAHAFPAHEAIFWALSFTGTFVPRAWNAPPTVDPSAYASGDLAVLAQHFLHYDFYVGTFPLLLWSMYLHQRTVAKPGLIRMLGRAGLWFLLAGPAGAAAILNWDRDAVTEAGEEKARFEIERLKQQGETRKTQ